MNSEQRRLMVEALDMLIKQRAAEAKTAARDDKRLSLSTLYSREKAIAEQLRDEIWRT
jgi:hypothetical protein